jgi:glycosyltransferase involved in cell wall biosynthesis
MKISVITLTYNSERYLEDCIKSVVNQDHQDKEYIIIDNQSKDQTLAIADKYKNNINLIISEKDKGLSDAMNKALKIASGEYVLFMHSDDMFVNTNSLSILANALLRNNNNEWATGYLQFIDKKGNIFKKDDFFEINWSRMMIRNVIRHQACLVKRNIALDILFDERLKYAMDYLFFLNLWQKAGPPLIVKEHISKFRVDGNNLSSNFVASLTDEFRARKYFRKRNNQEIYLISDFVIFILRLIKIYTYHNFRYKRK